MITQTQQWGKRVAVKIITWVIGLLIILNAALWLVNFGKYFEASKHRSFLAAGLLLIQEIVIIAPLWWFIIRKKKLAALGFRGIGVWKTIKWTFAGLGVSFLARFLFAIVALKFGYDIPGFGIQESHIPMFGTAPVDLLLAGAILIVIAPIVEELFFRGFLFQTFLQKFSPARASIITAFIFSAIHFEFEVIGLMFLIALVLNWMLLRTRSIIPGIVFHIFNNGLALFAEWLVSSGYVQL